ncbi:MAG: cyclic nucleotide-binding domain-containing protein [Chitinispirillia bacterium]|nr:cyclic nucleotide-binding domain-containing protein [Chitinispirillia bacterium]MCL2242295.1 cyclic nucleotide-binding domain-containing protein [Chitinispirillia bacterium]
MEEPLSLVPVTYRKGAYIIIEGANNGAGEFFIIRDGLVRIFNEISEIIEDAEGDIIGAGELFGVVSAMAGRASRIETALALTDVVLIPVRRSQFLRLIRQNASVAMKIMLLFSKRMRYLNEALAQNTIKKASPAAGRPPAVSGYTATGEKLVRAYAAGALIFAEGERGEEVFIIKSGSVKIVKGNGGSEILLAILKPGDIFGEMALLDSAARTASAVAYEECRLMALDKANFNLVLETQPQIIERLTTLLAERIWISYKQNLNARIPAPLGRLYDMLLISLEKMPPAPEGVLARTLDFGVGELVSMAGLTWGSGVETAVDEMRRNRLLDMNAAGGKIRILNAKEFSNQAVYYRKKQKAEIGKGRQPA